MEGFQFQLLFATTTTTTTTTTTRITKTTLRRRSAGLTEAEEVLREYGA